MNRIKLCTLSTGLFALSIASADVSQGKTVSIKAKAAQSKNTVAGDWKPDPSQLDNLAPETQVSGYSLRVPLGFTEMPQPPGANTPPGFDNHFYGGGRRSDGIAPALVLSIVTPPPDITGTLSLDDALDGVVAMKKRAIPDMTQSAIQSGTINGLAFERVYFKGMSSNSAGTRMAHGLAYVAKDGDKIVTFEAEDAESHSDDTLPTLEASVLTFHKSSPK